jgi:hypothetical protein
MNEEIGHNGLTNVAGIKDPAHSRIRERHAYRPANFGLIKTYEFGSRHFLPGPNTPQEFRKGCLRVHAGIHGIKQSTELNWPAILPAPAAATKVNCLIFSGK